MRALCMVGYPGETADEVRETLAFLCRHIFRISHISLTPFMLIRGTPIYRDPAAHGVTLVPDPVPRHQRIRFTAAATGPTLLSPAETQGFLQEATQVFEGFLADAVAGPTLSHAWMRASIRRHGWDPV